MIFLARALGDDGGDGQFCGGAECHAVCGRLDPGGDNLRAGTIAWLDSLAVQQDTPVLPAGTYTMTAKAILAAGTAATGITGWF